MTDTELICILIAALVGITWAFYSEMRIQALSGQVWLDKEKIKDDEITESVHELSDDDLNSEMRDLLSRTESPAKK